MAQGGLSRLLMETATQVPLLVTPCDDGVRRRLIRLELDCSLE